MTKHGFLLILTAILAVFGLFIFPAGAQDVNLDEMDAETMECLLEEILQRLYTEEPAEEPTAVPMATAVPTAEPTPEATAVPSLTEGRTFHVYENKKLVISNMPSYYFVNPTKDPEYRSVDECIDYCNKEVCRGLSYECFFNCVVRCSGKNPPPPAG